MLKVKEMNELLLSKGVKPRGAKSRKARQVNTFRAKPRALR